MNLNYYIVGMLLVAVILMVSGWGRRSGLVEGMLPFGQYRANTEYNMNSGDSVGKSKINITLPWNQHIPMNGGYKGFSYDKKFNCDLAKKLASSEYVYISIDNLLFLNFDSETGPTGTVYFSPQKPNDPVTSEYQMKSIIGKTAVTICKFRAQKWKIEMVDTGLNNCEVYISTYYTADDPCNKNPVNQKYYLSVAKNGNVYGSLYKNNIEQRWRIDTVGGKNLLVNTALNNIIDVGGSYGNMGGKRAVSKFGRGIPLTFSESGSAKFNNWPANKPPKFIHYKPTTDNPMGQGAGTGGWDTRFADVWNGTYSGKVPIVVKLENSVNKGVVTVGDKKYNVQLMGSNMVVGKDSKGKISFTGEMLSGANELPRVKFYTIDENGKYQNLSAKDSPDNLAGVSMFVANPDDYLAKNGYMAADQSKNLVLPGLV